MTAPNHFLTLADESRESILALLDQAKLYKEGRSKGARFTQECDGQVIGLYFEKASLRTRISFEVAIRRLGGSSIFETTKIGEREPENDFAAVASRYLDALVLRTFKHETIEAVAEHASVPVINALSNTFHPCQGLGDLLTIQEHTGGLEGVRVAFVGDGNNVARSLAIGCAKTGARFVLAAPQQYWFPDDFVEAYGLEGSIEITADPAAAVEGARVIYTDVWTSMGQEAQADLRRRAFRPFQVDAELVAKADPSAVIMHCLPAVRGEEATAEVLDGPQSVIYDQAENRMHVQQAVLKRLLS